MRSKGQIVLAAIATAMTAVMLLAVLAAADVIAVPERVRATLGLDDEGAPDPPCRIGLYSESPAVPPAPAGHWRSEPEVTKTQIEATAVAIGPVIYTVGGTEPGNLHTVLAYDTRSREWSEPARLPVGLNHVEAATHDGKLYVAGGYLDGAEQTDQFWEYDPATEEWTELAPLLTPQAAGSVAVIGDRLYVAGGSRQTFNAGTAVAPYGTLEVYDFDTGEWSYGEPMNHPRHHTSGAAVGGKFYVAGGRGDADHSLDTFEAYDPATDSWEDLPSLPLGVASPKLVAAAGKVVMIGGEDQNNWEEGDGWVTPSAWAYDPATRRWERLPDMGIDRRAGGAAVSGGRIYAIGGSYCPGLKPNGPVGTHTVESLPVSAL